VEEEDRFSREACIVVIDGLQEMVLRKTLFAKG